MYQGGETVFYALREALKYCLFCYIAPRVFRALCVYTLGLCVFRLFPLSMYFCKNSQVLCTLHISDMLDLVETFFLCLTLFQTTLIFYDFIYINVPSLISQSLK